MNVVRDSRLIGVLLGVCMLGGCVGADAGDEAAAPASDVSAEDQQLFAEVTDEASALAAIRSQPGLSDRVFVAKLSGGEEVPAVDTSADGFAVVLLDQAHGKIAVALRHNVYGPTDGHLHQASGGENGPVAIALAHFRDGDISTVMINASQIAALRAGKLYINVHSGAHTAGEIRGQVLRPGETLFVAPLDGAQETPPHATSSTGIATFVLNAAHDQAHFRYTSAGFVVTVAHLHRGIAGTAGPVAMELPVATTAEGDLDLTPEQASDLEGGFFYVNLHSAANVKGEVRGQVLLPGEKLYSANLTGEQEVPPVTTTNTASAMIIANPARDAFRYVLTTTATPTDEHLHWGPGGFNGPIAIPFTQVGKTSTGTASLTVAHAADLDAGRLYANVHTAAFPRGELRGQILKPGETLYTAVLTAANEVPARMNDATGGVSFILDFARSNVRFEGVVANLMPTAAHIHAGAAGVNGAVVRELGFSGTRIAGAFDIGAADLASFDASTQYVNVHSMDFPMGAIRGQITKK